MSESEQKTISLHVSSEPNSEPIVERRAEKSRRMKMTRPSVVAIASLGLLFGGWAVWHYFGSPNRDDQAEVLTELEGIESVTPLFDPAKRGESKRSRRRESSPRSVPIGKDTGESQQNVTSDSTSADVRLSRADVWLTGTIEVDESNEKIPLPERLSGGPNESTSLR